MYHDISITTRLIIDILYVIYRIITYLICVYIYIHIDGCIPGSLTLTSSRMTFEEAMAEKKVPEPRWEPRIPWDDWRIPWGKCS